MYVVQLNTILVSMVVREKQECITKRKNNMFIFIEHSTTNCLHYQTTYVNTKYVEFQLFEL